MTHLRHETVAFSRDTEQTGVTFDSMADLISRVRESKAPDTWILISPDGLMYLGDANQLAPVLMEKVKFGPQGVKF